MSGELATPGPVTPAVLEHARQAVLAAIVGGILGARTALADVPAGQLIDTAAVLAAFAGRPDLMVLTGEEWVALAAALGVQP